MHFNFKCSISILFNSDPILNFCFRFGIGIPTQNLSRDTLTCIMTYQSRCGRPIQVYSEAMVVLIFKGESKGQDVTNTIQVSFLNF